MGLTFIIGFFVAGVIKVIANWADLLNLYNSHKEEIQTLKGTTKPEEHSKTNFSAKRRAYHRHRFVHKINEALDNLNFKKRVTA